MTALLRVDHGLVAWIADCLAGGPKCLGLRAGLSDVLVSSTSAPKGTPSLSIVGCIGDDSKAECSALVESFMGLCGTDRLQLSVGETKELMVDYRRSRRRSPPTPNWMVWRRLRRREGRGFYFFLCVCLIPIPVFLFTSINLAAITPEFP